MRLPVVLLSSIVACATVGNTSPIASSSRSTTEDRVSSSEENNGSQKTPANKPETDWRLLAEIVGGGALLTTGTALGISVGSARGRTSGFQDGHMTGLDQGRKEINVEQRETGRAEGYRDAMANGHGDVEISACVAIKELLDKTLGRSHSYSRLLEIQQECMKNPVAVKKAAEQELQKIIALAAAQHPEYQRNGRHHQQPQNNNNNNNNNNNKPKSESDAPPPHQASQFSLLEKPAKAMFDKLTSVMRNAQAQPGSMIAPPPGGMGGRPASFVLPPKFGPL